MTESLTSRIKAGAVSAAERKVAAALIGAYPTAALGTVEAIALRAKVSAPTVLRFVAKLGFARFADFQAEVLQDVERRLGSPLQQMTRDPAEEGADHVYRRTLLMQADALRTAADQTVPQEFDAIARLLADPRMNVKVLGGRYSQNLAQRLATHLGQIRPGVTLLQQQLGFAYDILLDIGARDLIVVFDYRRYQEELLTFAAEAKRSGAKLCLMTDIWRSPIAEHADAILTSPDASASPFGSRVVPTAQIEALIAAVVELRREEVRDRFARIEELRGLGARKDDDA
ncbi:MurR/RpiR family transcriptional regulator [Acidimangrovimonas sediminis]|uniref:MurR/RpiR family transcriptional regulator n=1 Tax=Acidimangrovimonas sediminis TaxID=2056283 RepID=UPI001E468076|nr:MurR/RpiR family transcriptional regulator [Acidimangrovimonas sediminis]